MRAKLRKKPDTKPVPRGDAALAVAATFCFIGNRIGGKTLIRCQITKPAGVETHVLTNDAGHSIDVFEWGGGSYANAVCDEQKELLCALKMLVAVARMCHWDSSERPIAECYPTFRLEVITKLPRREFHLGGVDLLKWLRRDKTSKEIVAAVRATMSDFTRTA
jgi:hypothetical protein